MNKSKEMLKIMYFDTEIEQDPISGLVNFSKFAFDLYNQERYQDIKMSELLEKFIAGLESMGELGIEESLNDLSILNNIDLKDLLEVNSEIGTVWIHPITFIEIIKCIDIRFNSYMNQVIYINLFDLHKTLTPSFKHLWSIISNSSKFDINHDLLDILMDNIKITILGDNEENWRDASLDQINDRIKLENRLIDKINKGRIVNNASLLTAINPYYGISEEDRDLIKSAIEKAVDNTLEDLDGLMDSKADNIKIESPCDCGDPEPNPKSKARRAHIQGRGDNDPQKARECNSSSDFNIIKDGPGESDWHVEPLNTKKVKLYPPKPGQTRMRDEFGNVPDSVETVSVNTGINNNGCE